MQIAHPSKALGQKVVVIVGAGFAGLNTAKTLAHAANLQVVLIDQRNHHLFQPLLYQVATAGLNPSDIAVPIRAQFAGSSNVEIHMAQVQKVHLSKKIVTIQSTVGDDKSIDLEYDFLVLACGARHSYFGHPEWEEFAPGLKSLEQAIEIRKRILSIFETAENEFDPAIRAALLNFVIVGGGATGVELAGAIADISRTVLVNDFKNIDPSQTNIILLEAGPNILPQFSLSLSLSARDDLSALGVQVRVNTKVENITATGVQVPGEFIPSRCVLWAAGVQAAPLDFSEVVKRDRAGRIEVDASLTIPNHRDVFVVGDLAAIPWKGSLTVPGLAPAAIQAGRHAAEDIINRIQNKPSRPFRYYDKGQMATIGRRRAVVESGRFKMTGLLAWLAWLFIHILYLIGFKNRISVMTLWVWSYVFAKRGSRLITDEDWRLKN